MRIHKQGKTHPDLDDVRLMGCSRPDRLPDTPDLIREYQARQHEAFVRNQREIQITWGFVAVIAVLALASFCYNLGIAKQQAREVQAGVRL